MLMKTLFSRLSVPIAAFAVLFAIPGCEPGQSSDVSAALTRGQKILSACEVGITPAELRTKLQEYNDRVNDIKDEKIKSVLKQSVTVFRDSGTLMELLANKSNVKAFTGGSELRISDSDYSKDKQFGSWAPPLWDIVSRNQSVLATDKEDDGKVKTISIDASTSVQKLLVEASRLMGEVKR